MAAGLTEVNAGSVSVTAVTKTSVAVVTAEPGLITAGTLDSWRQVTVVTAVTTFWMCAARGPAHRAKSLALMIVIRRH